MTFALVAWLQEPVPVLTSNETRVVLWVIVGLFTLLGGGIAGMIGFGGKHLFRVLAEESKERKALAVRLEVQTDTVANRVDQVRKDHGAEIQAIYARVEHTNGSTVKSLSEMELKIGRIETIIDERLPSKAKLRAAK